MATQHELDTHERTHRLQRETPRRSRFRRAALVPALPPVPSLITEADPLRAIRLRDRSYRVAILIADVVAALLLVGLAEVWSATSALSWTVLALPIVVPLVNAANGLYQRDEQVLNKSTLDEAPITFRAATIATVIIYLLQSALLVPSIGAKVVGFTWVGLTVLLPACRTLARAAIREWLPPERCLVLGDEAHARQLASKLSGGSGVKSELVDVMPLNSIGHAKRSAVDDLRETVNRMDVHRVVVAGGEGTHDDELEAISAAKAVGVNVSVLPRVLEIVGSSASYDYVDGLTFLGVPRFGLSRASQLVKRGFDLAGSLLVLTLASPVMLAIAAAIKLNSRGPVFFRQERIGRRGRSFMVLKFRSMQDGADSLKDSLRDRNEQSGLFKIADDPRITTIGKLLRRTSLDELPQLLNVVRGEMSLVGPRPLVPEEDRQIHGWHRRRLHLTPGMTGPWQVLGSSRIPLNEMVTIDYLYVANWSLWTDVKIMLRTVATVVARKGR